ncbi:hypothetical protein C7446_2648 [Kushneria sinocarnis]|uniref:Uncharacterized protein n=1 Tax=Kushneria sinocarnis TaxID=595502 RepID=A0A420WUU8_9GAMM|nr:hypothetical protein [Kushneria sinocarnis]RKQ97225.1 hypothetical protein C7446_2648 [Kushneria sinocarnis]
MTSCDEPAADHSQEISPASTDATDRDRRVVGLVAAPELPQVIAEQLCHELPDLLTRHLDDHYQWELQMVTDPLTGSADDTSAILGEVRHYHGCQQWDYAICLTDLPIVTRRHVVVADVSVTDGVALISLPALGSVPMLRRLREAILQLVSEMHHGSSDREREQQNEQVQETDAPSRLRGSGARQLMGRRLSECLSPIHRTRPTDERNEIDVRFVSKRNLFGHLRLLSGMVRANRPWTIFPAFRNIVAVAFATGAYGLIFPTMWRLADAYGIWRHVLVMLAAMIAMIVWIILAHGLWEGSRNKARPLLVQLYNATTVITLGTAVLLYYAVLLLLFALAVTLFVPTDLLHTTLGHPIGPMQYATLAWLVTSVATVAGALGAGLESDETVRRATYGYRQRRRHELSHSALTEQNQESEQ